MKRKIYNGLLNFFLRTRYRNQMPSTAQDGFDKLGKIEYPKEGGINTYHEWAKYPFPGFVSTEDLNSISKWKRLLPLGADFFQKQIKEYIPENTNHYSRGVREIYRVLSLAADRHEHSGPQITFRKFRDIICLIMEKDDAYKFPLMDALSTIDPKQFELDDRDLYWACFKPYAFGGKEGKEKLESMKKERIEYEMEKKEDLELDNQLDEEKRYLESKQVQELAVKIGPEINKVLEKHKCKPDLESVVEKQVDITIRVRLPKENK